MTSLKLEPGSLYIVLKLRSDSLEDKTFHVMLYLHKSDANTPTMKLGGTKYHITNLRSDMWLTDHGPESAIMKIFLLNCLVRVASDIPSDRWDEIDAIIRAKDGEINVDGMNCRVWVVQTLQRLQDAGVRFLGRDVEEIDNEAFKIGNLYRESAVNNEQPRPVVDVSENVITG